MKYALRLLENWVSSLFLCYNRITIVKNGESNDKTPFITADKLEQITAEFPTPSIFTMKKVFVKQRVQLMQPFRGIQVLKNSLL